MGFKMINYSVVNTFVNTDFIFSGHPVAVVFNECDCHGEISQQLNILTTFISRSKNSNYCFRYFFKGSELSLDIEGAIAGIWALKKKFGLGSEINIETKSGIIHANFDSDKLWIKYPNLEINVLHQTNKYIAEIVGVHENDLEGISKIINGSLIIPVKNTIIMDMAYINRDKVDYLLKEYGIQSIHVLCQNETLHTKNIWGRTNVTAIGSYLNSNEDLVLHQEKDSIIYLKENKIGGVCHIMSDSNMYIDN
jgi:predicted PhzF superfamily epimerase YddE/YHI9